MGDRDLEAVDQVALLDWLFEDDFPAAVRLGPLTSHADAPDPEADSIVLADRSDMALAPLSWLYRAHRITASQYLQVLSNARGQTTH